MPPNALPASRASLAQLPPSATHARTALVGEAPLVGVVSKAQGLHVEISRVRCGGWHTEETETQKKVIRSTCLASSFRGGRGVSMRQPPVWKERRVHGAG
jgi:hypothetical protein